MEAFIHGANVLYLLSYLMRDILWLRVFTVIAALCLIAYFYLQPEPLLTAIYWNLVFVVLNIYWICRLILERRSVPLNDEEATLYEASFRTMRPREMLKLLKIGDWETHPKDAPVVDQGDQPDRLSVISSGTAELNIDGTPVDELGTGRFVGTVSYITDEPAEANVVARDAMRCFCWPSAQLRGFLTKDPELRAAFQRVLTEELAVRLQTTWATAPLSGIG